MAIDWPAVIGPLYKRDGTLYYNVHLHVVAKNGTFYVIPMSYYVSYTVHTGDWKMRRTNFFPFLLSPASGSSTLAAAMTSSLFGKNLFFHSLCYLVFCGVQYTVLHQASRGRHDTVHRFYDSYGITKGSGDVGWYMDENNISKQHAKVGRNTFLLPRWICLW